MNFGFFIINIPSLVIGLFVGIIVGMIIKGKGASLPSVLALIVSFVWLGFHIVSYMQYQVVPSLPYIFNIIGAAAIGSSMGFKLSDVISAITSKMKD